MCLIQCRWQYPNLFGGSVYSLPAFLEPPCFRWWFRRFFLRRLLRLLLLHWNFPDDRIWKGCLYVCFKRLIASPDNIRTAMAALHILAWLPWQLTATPRTKHVIVFRHYSSCTDLGEFIRCRPFFVNYQKMKRGDEYCQPPGALFLSAISLTLSRYSLVSTTTSFSSVRNILGST